MHRMHRMRQTTLAALLATMAAPPALAAPGHGETDVTFTCGNRNTDFAPAFDAQFRAQLVEGSAATSTALLAGGLVHPWGIDQLPDGSFLVTERPGRLRHVTADGTVHDPIEGVPEVYNAEPETGWATQAGLLDVKAGRLGWDM